LRVLYGVESPLNASQIARRTGLSKPAVATALDELGALGVVASSPAGRAWVHQLVRDNYYVRRMVAPVFEAESGMQDALERTLVEILGADAESIVLFGSRARGQERPESDIDVVVVAHDEEAKQRLTRIVEDQEREMRRNFGASMSVLLYDRAEAQALADIAPALMTSLIDDGVVLQGSSPAEWAKSG
jgi:predicted nucleotidyltransferase